MRGVHRVSGAGGPHRPLPWPCATPDAQVMHRVAASLLSPSTVEDIQSLLCRRRGGTRGQAEDGGGSAGLHQRAEALGGSDGTCDPGKSEWCLLPRGRGPGPLGRKASGGSRFRSLRCPLCSRPWQSRHLLFGISAATSCRRPYTLWSGFGTVRVLLVMFDSSQACSCRSLRHRCHVSAQA